MNRIAEASLQKEIEQEILSVLKDVSQVVGDWQRMLETSQHVTQELAQVKYTGSASEQQDACDFLTYLADDRFTFLGYCQYDLVHGQNGQGDELVPNHDSALGMFRTPTHAAKTFYLDDLPEATRKEAFTQWDFSAYQE